MRSLIILTGKSGLLLSILIACLLVSCSTGTSNSKPQNALIANGLKGRVKVLSKTVYSANEESGEIQKGQIQTKSIHSFNENGASLELKDYDYKENVNSTNVSTYDLNDKIIESLLYLNDKLITKKTFKYDERGNEIERNEYNSKNGLVSKNIFIYDKKGNMLEERFYNQNGSLNKKFLIRNDKHGNKIEVVGSRSDGTVEYKLSQKYDREGNLLKRTMSDPTIENMEVMQTFKYDKDNKLIEETSDYSDMPILKKTTTYVYDKYDIKGNWLNRLEKDLELNAIRLTEREIEYY